MVTRRKVVSAMAALGASCMVLPLGAQEKDTLPKPPSKLVLGEAQVKDLLLLMDTDKNGKISKQEWMDFASAEFDRLDTDHSGELDPKELVQSQLRATRPASVGKSH